MRTRTLGSLACVSAVMVGACEAPALPLGPDAADLPYEFRLIRSARTPEVGTGDTLVFHWGPGAAVSVFVSEPADASPRASLRVREAPDAARPSLKKALQHAATLWNAAAVFGEVRLLEAVDPSAARAVLAWADLPTLVRAPEGCTGPLTTGATSTQGCLAETPNGGAGSTKRLDTWTRVDGGPSQIRLLITVSAREGLDEVSLRRLVSHELGHALGILNHSRHPGDLMWSGVIASDTLTRADRATLRTLYQARRDVVP
ncbi:MAG: matrixin family metalloprotease [Gemmatimonadetes bacterium]|nr:matrixin family metalloprotease [Gemmatimonadota bacterium]